MMSFNESKSQFPLKAPSQSFTGRISRLIIAVAILDYIDITVLTTRGEARKVIVQVKIATAAMSPEIFLVFGNTGFPFRIQEL